jgi:TonB family protein
MRQAFPYVLFSLAVHAGLFGAFLLWRLPVESGNRRGRIVLEFVRAGGAPGAQAAALPPAPGMPVKEGKPLALPGAVSRLPLRESLALRTLPGGRSSALDVFGSLPSAPARVAEPSGAPALPTAAEALRGLTPAVAAPGAPAAQAGDSDGYAPATALEWEGRERSLLRRPQLRFPELLKEKGLEVDVEVEFVVAPSGQVVQTSITRSSGFASVDREVEQALRDALFDSSAQEDVGRIQFRFRLERNQ